ncbi:MAG: DUF1800 domain-containing protein [Planctomycetales bacterium]|nr:DUF1800 domain-containing protein [Planctomycetales bacterium]
MPINWDTIDPAWAWSPYQPSAEQPWDRRRAAHLFRRAGFGATAAELVEAVSIEPAVVVEQLVGSASDSGTERSDPASDALARAVLATGDPHQLGAWWAYAMLGTPTPLVEKMTLFWHGHFATSAEKVTDAELMFRQNRLLRQHALGDFAALTHAVARDPAMLIYLDSATNRKAHPNENFARELMELFCLGEGNYTERDIQELARCFTGWEIRQRSFRFNRYQHDAGDKSILGRTGPFPDSEAVDVVLDQPAATQFIVGKLFRFFVADEPAPTAALLQPLADDLREHNWDVRVVVRRMLGSQLFFSDIVRGRKVRSPVDLILGLLRPLQGSTNTYQVAEDLERLGQGLFFPPNVKGWDGGRTWINSASLLDRSNAVGSLLRSSKTRFGGENLGEYLSRDNASPAATLNQLAELLLAVPLHEATQARLLNLYERSNKDRNQRWIETLHALATLPEFQLC